MKHVALRAMVLLAIQSGACSNDDRDGDGSDAASPGDASLIDNEVDEFGFALVGENVNPPLYQRVVARSCAETGLGDQCRVDGDCGEGSACICGGTAVSPFANRCTPAECRSLDDCNGGRCLLSTGSELGECCSWGHPGLFCSRSGSTCTHGGDCPGNGISCVYAAELDIFECQLNTCSCAM